MTIQRYAEKLQELRKLDSDFVLEAEQALEAMKTMNRAPDSADWKAINHALEVARQGAAQEEMKPAPKTGFPAGQEDASKTPMPEEAQDNSGSEELADDGAATGEVGGPPPVTGEVGTPTAGEPGQLQEPEDPQPA